MPTEDTDDTRIAAEIYPTAVKQARDDGLRGVDLDRSVTGAPLLCFLRVVCWTASVH